MTGARILVTGAGGFVCSEVALALARAGWDVVATDRAFDAATARRLAGLRCVAGPLDTALRDLAGLAPDAVIHGAALTAEPARLGLSAAGHVAANMAALTDTLLFARSEGAARFLFVSSMGVFEPGDGPLTGGCLTETAEPTGTIPYAAAKRAGEVLTAGAAEDGFSTLSLRLGNIVGPHEAVRDSRQTLCLVSRMIAEVRATGTIRVASPSETRDWAWLPDLAGGIAALLDGFPDAGTARVLHAGTPPPCAAGDLADAIAARLPGTRVLRGEGAPGLRPPMASGIPSAFSGLRWTPVTQALDLLLPGVAA